MVFNIEKTELQAILSEYKITDAITQVDEILRYKYEEQDPSSREVRLILKVSLANSNPIIVKFKNEKDVTMKLIEEQTEFSQHLLKSGAPTTKFYSFDGKYVLCRHLCGYDVLITVENFMNREIKTVTPEISYKIGRLLAMTHNIAERDNCHVQYPVLFDPFNENDLFSYKEFIKLSNSFDGEELCCFTRICDHYQTHMQFLDAIRNRKKYAVQGDVSDCNLFITDLEEIGMFDFNRCGDNILFCDAIMQGIFESRLMDYDCEPTEAYSDILLSEFLSGYNRIRAFDDFELNAIPHLYAIISAFWSSQIIYDIDSLKKLSEKGERIKISALLEKIERQILTLKNITLLNDCINIV